MSFTGDAEVPQEVREKYAKIKAMAEHPNTPPNEKQAARNAAAKLEAKYPELLNVPPPQAGARGFGAFWSYLQSREAQDAFWNLVAEVEAMAESAKATGDAVALVEEHTKVTVTQRSGKVRVTLTIEDDVLLRLGELVDGDEEKAGMVASAFGEFAAEQMELILEQAVEQAVG